MTWLRKRGFVPWDWLVDETRTVEEWQCAPTIRQGLLAELEYLRVNPWGGKPPLLIVESRSLGGVLRSLTAEYVVPLAATAGRARGFLHTKVLPLLPRPVLYLGDLDLSGDQIEANTRRVLERELGASLNWMRVAITEKQAAELEAAGLSPIEKADRRYRPPRVQHAWETEALGQRRVLSLVRAALDALLPEPLEDERIRERVERARQAKRLTGGRA